MTDRDAARDQLARLTARWHALPEARRNAQNEAELRHSFILPLFNALGWDITDPDHMTAEEDISHKKVDFGFYVNRIPAFYVETKRLRAGVAQPEFVQQAISYAYLKGVTWAVLTNFAELRVFNASADTAPDQAQFLHLTCDQYANGGFDDLWLLSRAAMTQRPRPIDQRAQRYGRLPPRRPVTEQLFENLTDWRQRLYREFSAYLPPLLPHTPREIDNAVQKLLDRLIFLRAAEDRGVEPSLLKQLLAQHPRGQWWPALKTLFRQMNSTYNSNLFAPHTLDELDLHDPDLLKSVIDGLYRFNRYLEFDFNAIDADVLGAAYEQYLGHKQRRGGDLTTETRQRQRKRRLQGIYYTPKDIVRYIVDATVGAKLRAGADPYALRILDPACGSGSFLIGAFDVLDAWLAQHDAATPPQQRRHRLLTECLYGVDLDDQAVEVTRLNLVLRAAPEQGVRLPMLDHIQQGDSLTADPALTAHPFAWDKRFARVTEAGGFDIVLGNPPYVRGELLSAAFKTAAAHTYTTATGAADLYVYFMEQSVRLLKPDGVYGVIVANKWMRAAYGERLRAFMQPHVREIIDFGDLPVFQEATTYPAIVIADKTPPAEDRLAVTQVTTLEYPDLATYVTAHRYPAARAGLLPGGWTLAAASDADVLAKLKQGGIPLSEYLPGRIRRGVVTGYNEAFVISRAKRDELVKRDPASADVIKPFLVGADVKRYHPLHAEKYLIFMRRGIHLDQYPAIHDHLLQYKDRLTPRPPGHTGTWGGRKAGNYQWYELQDPIEYHAEFDQPKIVNADIAVRGQFMLDTSDHFYLADTTFFFNSADRYLLGVLNSKPITFFAQKTFANYRGGYLRFKSVYMRNLPIPVLAADDPRRARIRELVDDLLALHAQQAAALLPSPDRAAQIAELDAALDRAVCAAYGLSAAETALVLG